MIAATDTEQPSDIVGWRIKAERDSLLELIAIFTHDLSNPLQSLTVLCELALDETPADSEDHLRTRQCLEAAERMRKLIHGLAGVTRHADGPGQLGATLQRIMAVLARRFDRHNVELTVDIKQIERVVPPRSIEFALLNLSLGIVAATSELKLNQAKVALIGRRGVDGEGLTIDLSGEGRDREGQHRPLLPTPRHVRRVEQFVAQSGVELRQHERGVSLLFGPATEG